VQQVVNTHSYKSHRKLWTSQDSIDGTATKLQAEKLGIMAQFWEEQDIVFLFDNNHSGSVVWGDKAAKARS
jgi:hypothetical protein